jgi:hypothetical protein
MWFVFFTCLEIFVFIWDWVSFLAYPNLFGTKSFVVVVVRDIRF